jgi:alanine-synthesizing transaminase
MIFDGNKAPSMASVAGDVPVIVFSSFSKFFMHPGWRIGYACFNDPSNRMLEITQVCNRLASSYGHNKSAISHPILVAATRTLREFTSAIKDLGVETKVFKGAVAEVKEFLENLQIRRDYTYKRISRINGMSVVNAKATMYMFPKVEAIGKVWKTTEHFMTHLAEEEGEPHYRKDYRRGSDLHERQDRKGRSGYWNSLA